MTRKGNKKGVHTWRMRQAINRLKSHADNNNIAGNFSFAEYTAQKKQTYQTILDELQPLCGRERAMAIIETIRMAEGGEYEQDCLPIRALGETLHHIRNEVKVASNAVRKSRGQQNIVILEQERIKQRLDRLFPAYWMVMRAFYFHYNQFMKKNS